MTALPSSLSPRKAPVQTRSRATVDAIHTATIQVLTADGLARCTTTRVAERAGVSVGSLYQYYPNREALLAAALDRHISKIAQAVEEACESLRSRPLAEMVEGLVDAFLAAKFKDPDESRSLYAVSEVHGGSHFIARSGSAIRRSITGLLATAPDAEFDDLDTIAAMVVISMGGPARALLSDMAPPGFEGIIGEQIKRLVLSYLRASSA